jgi:hypothetical protein
MILKRMKVNTAMTAKTDTVPSCEPNGPPYLVELNARLRREADSGMVAAARAATEKEQPPPPPLPSTASAAAALGADGPTLVGTMQGSTNGQMKRSSNSFL